MMRAFAWLLSRELDDMAAEHLANTVATARPPRPAIHVTLHERRSVYDVYTRVAEGEIEQPRRVTYVEVRWGRGAEGRLCNGTFGQSRDRRSVTIAVVAMHG